MITKVLIYVYYDHLEYENNLNAWLKTQAGENTMPCWNPNDVDGFIDSICTQIQEEDPTGDVDLYLINEANDLFVDFHKKFEDRRLRLLNTSKSTWTKNEVKKVIRDNFNKEFQGILAENTVHEKTTEKTDEKIPLSRLMIEIAKGEIY